MKFELCEDKDFYLRMAIIGPAGSGKTYTALKIATEMPYTKIGILDTESQSARRYAKSFNKPFLSLELDDFSPANYVSAIAAAEKEGLEVLIIDSLSHAWMGKGGVLDKVDAESKRREGHGNTFAAWKSVTPEHNKMVNAILRAPMHIISTLRSKTEYVVEVNDRGKSIPKKIGLAPVQKDGLEYEFDIFAEMNLDHEMTITKTRCLPLNGQLIKDPGTELAQTIAAWLKPPDIEPWLKSIEKCNHLGEIQAIREALNQKKLHSELRFTEQQQRQLRAALDEARVRLDPRAS